MLNRLPFGVAVVCLFAAIAPIEAAERPLTFNRDVAPIIFQNCTTCHRPGEAAPFTLLSYDDVKQRAKQIVTTTEHRFMPPWKPDPEFRHFEGERWLDDEEIDTLRDWVDAGAVEGDPRERPSPPRFPDGWRLGKPDLVLTMPEAFTVPAEGKDLFQNFVLPVPLNERRYVQAIEFRPGNGKVVHHARILLDETGELRQKDLEQPGPGFEGMDAQGAHFPEGHFLGWAPGKMPRREDVAWPLAARTDIIVQMHLKPTGRQESVKASIGLYFSNKAPAIHPVLLRLGSKTIDIPPNESSYVVTDSYTLPVPAKALSIYPHAHYLAHEMTVVAEMPDGRTERLLRISDWDFNWQDEYEFVDPVDLPKGARLVMRFVYDNSSTNPRNPSSPPRRVLSGPEGSDEMGELLIQFLAASEADATMLRAEASRKSLLAEVAGEEKRITDVPGDYSVRNSLGVHYVQLGRNDEARAQFLAALELSPNHAVAHYNLGLIAILANQVDEAFLHLRKALEVKPSYAEAHSNLGVLLEATGKPDEAFEHYRKALETRPDNAAALANVARQLMRRDRPDEATDYLERLQRLQPDNAVVYGNLAAAYSASGQASRAVRAARDAIQRAIASKNDALVRQLTVMLQDLEKQEQAGGRAGSLP
jgi:Flp pilus assembly protein TadD/mono/diheme cytochrome c family protein